MAIENEAKRPPLGWVLVAAAIALACAVLLKSRQAPQNVASGEVGASSRLQIGKPAPDFELEYPPGTTIKLSSLKGKAVLLNFWASWCEPCMEEMPMLAALEKGLNHDPFLLLALNADDEQPGNRATRRTTMPKNLIYRFDRAALSLYDVSSIPLSVLIDAQGNVREVFLGPRNWLDERMMHSMIQATH